MFDSLHSKLENALKKIRGHGILTAKDITAVMKERRLALLEADVNFKVAKDFCEQAAQKAVGEDVLKSLTPDQQVLKIVYEQLSTLMGSEASDLNLAVAPPAVIMLVGLQGSGKTTTAAKLAALLKKDYRRKPLLVSADVYRPAAIEQLQKLGAQLGLAVYDTPAKGDPVKIAQAALIFAAQRTFDAVILDTAGRLQIDPELMLELKEMAETVHPHEILLVADCMTGQEAVNVAKGFDQALEIDGLILTKLDGDARGGAALSMRAVTGRPIKFVGTGENADALEVFHPQRMASRILGMGDVLTLIEKAVKEVKVQDTVELQKKLRKNSFSLEDFLNQMNLVKRMGSVSSLASLIPGLGKLVDKINPDDAEHEMKRIEAIILSMTPDERRNHAIINGSRRRRIAKGSGTSVEQVNQLLKQFLEMRKMMSTISKMGLGGMAGMVARGGLGNLGNLFKR